MKAPHLTTRRELLLALPGFLALVAFSTGGRFVSDRLHLPIPGTVVGLLVLLAGLVVYGRVPVGLRLASALLIRHLNLFYIPAALGVIAYLGLLRADLLAILVALVPGTWAALGVSALVFRPSPESSEEP